VRRGSRLGFIESESADEITSGPSLGRSGAAVSPLTLDEARHSIMIVTATTSLDVLWQSPCGAVLEPTSTSYPKIVPDVVGDSGPFSMAVARTSYRSKPARATPSRPPTAAEPISPTLAFLRLLWAVDHGLRSLSKQMHAGLGLTGPQRLVLRMLGQSALRTPSELAEFLHLDRGTLSGILGRLTTQRLLTRRRSDADGRSVHLALTARGRALDKETPGTVEDCVRRALASLPPAKIEAARQVLEAVARELAVVVAQSREK
jgi:DNA-binding MarR family transcriptional regulator